MAYPETDVIILCFSVVRPDSMENVKTKWIPELKKYLPNTPIILVGTQCDLRGASSSTTNSNNINTNISIDSNNSNDKATFNTNNNSNNCEKKFTTLKDGEELKNKINAFKYIECSALTQHNIVEVFDSCILAHIQSKQPKKNRLFNRLFSCFGKSNRSYSNNKYRKEIE